MKPYKPPVFPMLDDPIEYIVVAPSFELDGKMREPIELTDEMKRAIKKIQDKLQEDMDRRLFGILYPNES